MFYVFVNSTKMGESNSYNEAKRIYEIMKTAFPTMECKIVEEEYH